MSSVRLAACALLSGFVIACAAATAAHAESRKEVAATDFAPVLAPAPGQTQVHLPAYRLDARPVTNRQFLEFVRGQPRAGDATRSPACSRTKGTSHIGQGPIPWDRMCGRTNR